MFPGHRFKVTPCLVREFELTRSLSFFREPFSDHLCVGSSFYFLELARSFCQRGVAARMSAKAMANANRTVDLFVGLSLFWLGVACGPERFACLSRFFGW